MPRDSLELAAPAPSIPWSSTTSSRPPSRSRPGPPPPKSKARPRPRIPEDIPANPPLPADILLNPASPDVIGNLIASFPIIDPDPASSTTLLPSGVATPVRASRYPSKAPTPRQSASPSRVPPNTTHRFVQELQHPVEDIAELTPEEDAAEPPVVRTSRPPSSFPRPSNQNGYRKTKPRFVPSPRSIITPPPERAREPSRPSIDVNSLRSGYQSPSLGGFSRRDSIDSTQSRESFQKRFWRLTSRKKGRDVLASSTASLRATANDSQRAGGASSSLQSPLNRSIPPSARLSEDPGDNVAAYGPTVSRRPRGQDELASMPGSREPPSILSNGVHDPPDALEDQDAVRISPLLQQTSFSRPVTANGPSGGFEPPSRPAPAAPSSGSQRLIINHEDEDETDVMKRIKQLKAAREERRRSWSLPPDEPASVPTPSPGPENGSVSPLPGTPPSTAMASQQLAEANHVEERKISAETVKEADPYALDVPPTPHFVTLKPKPVFGPELSKERAFIVDSATSTTRSTARPSLDVPSLPYQGPKRKGKSPSASPVIPAPGSPKPEHRRNRFSFSRSAPGLDDSRPSIDVINASVREFLSAPRLSQQVPFPVDGRRISFSEVGDPNGYVVFCCVGMGLTRFIMAYYDELATSLKLRLITPDRPGIGDSEPSTDGSSTPVTWPDDVQVICAKLGITKFSILAHSAGVIYALATALRMSQFLRGKIHLLAPWIPPSQLANPNATAELNTPAGGALPRSQRFLRMLPTSFLKLSNSSLAGLTRKDSPKSPGRARKSSDGAIKPRPGQTAQAQGLGIGMTGARLAPKANTRPPSPRFEDIVQIPTGQDFAASILPIRKYAPADGKERQRMYDAALTPAIWELATRNANPAVDLIICLERTRPIGFRYADVGSRPARDVRDTRSVADEPGCQWPGYGIVIHHGSKDTRVPVENAKWLGRIMPKAEVRVLEGQGHGLMATAGVMGSVLTEIGKEWEKSNWV